MKRSKMRVLVPERLGIGYPGLRASGPHTEWRAAHTERQEAARREGLKDMCVRACVRVITCITNE